MEIHFVLITLGGLFLNEINESSRENPAMRDGRPCASTLDAYERSQPGNPPS
jgi:hypothetical protein